jgi:hypothetical protein
MNKVMVALRHFWDNPHMDIRAKQLISLQSWPNLSYSYWDVNMDLELEPFPDTKETKVNNLLLQTVFLDE